MIRFLKIIALVLAFAFMTHLLRLVQTGEDMEKDLVTVLPADLKRYAGEIARLEQSAARVG